jgi:tetratricopeptide (TPR) repeat protein
VKSSLFEALSRTSKGHKALRYSAYLLILSGSTIAMVGCQDTRPLQLRYNAEKKLYQANQEREKLQIRPEFVADEQVLNLREQYRAVMEQALNSADSIEEGDSNQDWRQLQYIAYEAAQRAEEIAVASKDFLAARGVMEFLLAEATLPASKLLPAKLQLGRALQRSGEWDSARVIYDDLVTAFYPPIDSRGEVINAVLDLPYKKYLVESEIAERQERDSIVAVIEEYYNRLLRDYPSGNLSVSIHVLMSVVYQREARFEEALRELESVIDSTGSQALRARVRSWDISTFSLKLPRVSLDDIATVSLSGDDTLFVPLLFFKKAEAYLELGEYDSCRSAIYTIKNDFPQYFARNPVAQNLVAKSFVKEGKWGRAENEYRWMIETFPGAQVSFRAYIDILEHYRAANDERRYQEWQQRALDFYEQTARRRSNGRMEATAYSFIAEVYRLDENWSEAVKNLERIAQKFPTTEIGRRSALRGALLYRDKLADTVAAEGLFDVYKSSWPQSAN